MQEALEQVEDDDLHVLVVWEPILDTDSEEQARGAMSLIGDPRARHFWSPTQDLATAFQEPLGLDDELAWDVYLVYDAGSRWNDATTPPPAALLHQLPGHLPDEQMLQVGRLRRLLEIPRP